MFPSATTLSARPGTGRTRWAARWKPVLEAFTIIFGDRFQSAGTEPPETPLAR